MKKIKILTSIIVLLLTITIATALPGFMILDGEIKINNENAPIGTLIKFYMDGEQITTFTTTQEGVYGPVTINKDTSFIGTEIVVKINNYNADQTTIYQSPGYENLNLTATIPIDNDGDSYKNDVDCNDYNINIYPGAVELPDALDNDCDSLTDEGFECIEFTTRSCGTNVGRCQEGIQTCSSGVWGSCIGSIGPSTELCNNLDDDCNGVADEDLIELLGTNIGICRYGALECQAGNWIETLAPIEPSTETCDNLDNDCDGAADENNICAKAEICNGIDDDGDGEIDEGVKTTFYADSDGDTYGSSSSTTQACSAPSGYVSNSNDCNDNNANIKPGATEQCNLIDDDCDSQVDENVQTTFYADSDGDSYGNANAQTLACSQPSGFVTSSSDCNDNNANIKLGATETCDNLDNDCDGAADENNICAKAEICNGIDDNLNGLIDDGLNAPIISCGIGECYKTTTQTCLGASGWAGVCTPGSPSTEMPDGRDNNCDGYVDEGFTSIYYFDYDQDGFGESHISIAALSPSGKHTATKYGDCRPADPSSYPGALEACDGKNNDCDNVPDEMEGITKTCYKAAESKYAGIGECRYGYQICTGNSFADGCIGDVAPSNELLDGLDNDCDGVADENFDKDGDSYPYTLDCNDNNFNINPGALEICNGVDDDCSTIADDYLIYPPATNQNGVCGGATKICNGANGWAEPNYSAVENYEASEVSCDGFDNDCDGAADENFNDYDKDRIADCVDSDEDGDKLINNLDFIFGTYKDSDSNIQFSLEIAGQKFNSKKNFKGNKQIKFTDSTGNILSWFSYDFNINNVFDFRDLILKRLYSIEEQKSALIISGISSKGLKAFVIKKLDTATGLVCIKKTEISSLDQMSLDCTLSDEILLSCTGKNTLGYRCSSSGNTYRVSGLNIYAVKEIDFKEDITRDGCVDSDDFSLFSDYFGTTNKLSDFNNDGNTDFDDFVLFTDNFGKGKCNSNNSNLVEKRISTDLLSKTAETTEEDTQEGAMMNSPILQTAEEFEEAPLKDPSTQQAISQAVSDVTNDAQNEPTITEPKKPEEEITGGCIEYCGPWSNAPKSCGQQTCYSCNPEGSYIVTQRCFGLVTSNPVAGTCEKCKKR